MQLDPPQPECTSLSIRTPDDFHVHFRDAHLLTVVAPYTAQTFARALVMPNLEQPVCNLADVVAYRGRIKQALSKYPRFEPLMTLYLTDRTTPALILEAHASAFVKACKLYPAGATTNSALAVTSIAKIFPVLACMQQVGMVLCVHAESNEPHVDIFDREAHFVENLLPTILTRFPRLKIVLEHVTTSQAVHIVKTTSGNRLAATMTAHHLLYSRQAIFAGAKIRPNMFCLPILKREEHRQTLLRAVATDTEGKFFAGTDSAPHLSTAKLCTAGCAGIFTAHAAVELYAEAFSQAKALDKLEAFLSENGARFYGLPLNKGSITLVKKPKAIPIQIEVPCHGQIIPLRSGEAVQWSILEKR